MSEAELRTVGIALPADEVAEWRAVLADAIARAGRPLRLAPEGTPPGEIDYLVYNIDSGITDFAAYTRLRAILNTWAGVEKVLGRIAWPAHVPFLRMVEPGMTEGMTEYLVGQVLRHHIDVDRAIRQSTEGVWDQWVPPLARNRTIGILGLGELGRSVAAALAPFGFRVAGWSRSPKDLPGVDCRHGAEGLREVLSRADYLILLLPLTRETENLLDAERLGWLPRGACIVNAGRGGLIEDAALLDALARGHLRHATLDVFRTEPLPSDHPFWRHPKVTVTPHIAAITRTETAAEAMVAQIGRDLDGLALQHIVDPARGY